jgi:hypothetical protein
MPAFITGAGMRTWPVFRKVPQRTCLLPSILLLSQSLHQGTLVRSNRIKGLVRAFENGIIPGMGLPAPDGAVAVEGARSQRKPRWPPPLPQPATRDLRHVAGMESHPGGKILAGNCWSAMTS